MFIFFVCPKKTNQKKGHPLRRRFCSSHCKTSRYNLKAVQGFPPSLRFGGQSPLSLRLNLPTLAAREVSTFAALRRMQFRLRRNMVDVMFRFTVILPLLDFYSSKLMPVLAVKLKALLKEASFVLIFKGNSFIRLCRLKRNKNLNCQR